MIDDSILVSPDGLAYDLADIDDHELVSDFLRVPGVVLGHRVGHHHPDQLGAAEQVLIAPEES